MKRLLVWMWIIQGVLALAVSASAGEGSTPLFALNKISGTAGIGVVGLSDMELAQVEGSTVPRFPSTVTSQSNHAKQRNVATGSQGDVVQENRLTQTNGGASNGNQSMQSYIIAIETTIQKVFPQTLPWFSPTTTFGSGRGTGTMANEGAHAVINITNQGKTVTAVALQVQGHAVRNPQSGEMQAPSVSRIDQAANTSIPSLPPGFNIGGLPSGVGSGLGGGVRF